MKKLTNRSRKELKSKMAKALGDQIEPLSAPLQNILLDDLITAFESRLMALKPREPKVTCFVCEEMEVINQ